MPRALCIVLDSVGCGHAPDAAACGDAGADTLGHLFERVPAFALPALAALGLHEVLRAGDPSFAVPGPALLPGAACARLTEHSAGKDTTTGHWELMGAVTAEPLATFTRFPDELVAALEAAGGVRFLGNEAASGTAIIARLGAEHLRTGRPILYTSADSVLQLAAHEDSAVFGLERLLALCRTARELLDRRGLRVGRVIARPFTGDSPATFRRTPNRHDYSLRPPPNLLDRLAAAGVRTVAVGKIADIFAGQGISASHPTQSNADGMATIERLWNRGPQSRGDGVPPSAVRSAPRGPSAPPTLILANLVDFDTLFGHRRDPPGYARALVEFDRWLARFLRRFAPPDLLLVTADHGNDPFHPGTDHTREQVPLLALHPPRPPRSAGFAEVAALLACHFGLPPDP